jgi:hypothetical protein
VYSAARILGETVQYIDGTLAIFSWHFQSCSVLCGQNSRKNSRVHGRNSRHFFPGMFSPAVYSAAGILGKTAEYIDGFLAIFFLACSVLLCTLRSESKENSKRAWTELSPIFYSSWTLQMRQMRIGGAPKASKRGPWETPNAHFHVSERSMRVPWRPLGGLWFDNGALMESFGRSLWFPGRSMGSSVAKIDRFWYLSGSSWTFENRPKV